MSDAPNPLPAIEDPPAMTRSSAPASFLEACSRGEIGSREAIRGISGIGFSHLLDAMADDGLPLPRGREAATRREVEEALPILRAALRDPPPDPEP